MSSSGVFVAVLLIVQLASRCSADHFPLTHTKVVELSAIKHLTENLPVEIKCAALKNKLREVAVLDDVQLLSLTIDALATEKVPFRNSQYLLGDLEECKRLLGPTSELVGEALLQAQLKAANREIEKLLEKLDIAIEGVSQI